MGLDTHLKPLLVLLFLCGSVQEIATQELATESTFRKLRSVLLTNYDIHARPVYHHENTTEVTIGLSPIHVTDLNENRGIMILEGWVVMGWHDQHLTWNPEEYSGIKVLRVSDKEIWKPDITIYESRGMHISPWASVNALVYSNGHVMWVPPATMNLICGSFDYTDYPEDTQQCKLTIASWTHDGNEIDIKIQSENSSLEEYKMDGNPHWRILDTTGTRNVKYYSCCEEPYTSAVYYVKVKRMNVPFSSLCSIPDTVARILILCMFWMPNGTRKLLVGCTSLLILTTIAASITRSLPSPAAAPAALYKTSIAMTLGIAALIVEIFILIIASLRISPPAFLDSLVSSAFCQMCNPCSNDEYRNDIMENKVSAATLTQWPFLATLLDRAAFVAFAVLLLSL